MGGRAREKEGIITMTQEKEKSEQEGLFELQEKTEFHTNMLKSCYQRKLTKEREVKVSTISMEQLQEFDKDTKTYPALGRTFVSKTLDESIKLLEEDIQFAKEDAKKLEYEMKYHERQLENCRDQLKEIMDSKAQK